MTSRVENHQRAPIIAAVVAEYREVFGDDCKVLYAKEGDFEVGALPPDDKRCRSELGQE